MRSLFLKIFLSFWAAQALFVILAILVTSAVRPADSPRFEYFRETTAEQAALAFEHGGQAELRRQMEAIERSLRTNVYLFAPSGEELSGRSYPNWARQMALGADVRLRGLWGWLAPNRRVAQPVTSTAGNHYVLIIERPVTIRLWFIPARAPGIGVMVAIVSSGLVCFLLARYLTSPVVRLRAATRRLAEGDLTARAGGLRSRRRDEIAQLVHDFDGMAERLEGLVNSQSRLLHDISHELRSPLARLNVALGLARQRIGPEAEPAISRIELEASRLNELIARLLVLARLEGGEEPAMQAIHLDELVQEIVKDAEFEALGRNCQVKCEIVDRAVVSGNPALLHSAIENVVRNAMRYTREGTQVEIRLEEVHGANGPEAVIRVSDQGPGVPEESLEKMFRPFYRIDDARVRQTGGVGLGLAIADRALRLHQGSAKAANRPGGGLVVELRLPAIVPTAAEVQAEEEPQANETSPTQV